MADLQSQSTIAENIVVNSKAETPIVVNQKLLSALNYLRDELEKVQKENKELSTERTTLMEQLETEKNKNINIVISSNSNVVEDNHSTHHTDNSDDFAFL